MDTHGPSRRHSSLILAAILAAGCAASPAATGSGPASAGQPTTAAAPTGSPAAGAIEPAHLRMLDPDDKDRPSQAAIDGFLEELAVASGGAITIDFQYGAGGTTGSGRERVVTDKVVSGEVELAMAPVRAWADAGVTSVQALSTPFLIDSDPLLTAVATDPLVQPMLDAMADHGLVGLAIWPEDLRHPFAWDSTGGPLLRAEDFQGKNIWTLPSSLQSKIMEALGRHSRVRRVPGKAGRRRDHPRRGVRPGDRCLGPRWRSPNRHRRYHVLPEVHGAGRGGRGAGAGCRRPSRMPSDGPPGPERKQRSGPIRWTQPNDVRVLRSGRQGRACWSRQRGDVRAGRRTDDRAHALRTRSRPRRSTRSRRSRPRSPPAPTPSHACRLSARRPTLVPVEHGPKAAFIPDGVYRSTRTRQELPARGLNAFDAGNNSGTWTLRLTGGVGTWELDHDNGSGKEVCDLTFTLRDDRIRLKCADHPAEWFDFRWTLDDNELVIRFVDVFTGLEYDRAGSEVIFGGPWTKVE